MWNTEYGIRKRRMRNSRIRKMAAVHQSGFGTAKKEVNAL